MKTKALLSQYLVIVGCYLSASASAQRVVTNPEAACQALGASLKIDSVTVNFAQYLPAGSNITLTQAYNLSNCGYTSQVVSSDMCRLAMYVATSYRSGEYSSVLLLHRRWKGVLEGKGKKEMGGGERKGW